MSSRQEEKERRRREREEREAAEKAAAARRKRMTFIFGGAGAVIVVVAVVAVAVFALGGSSNGGASGQPAKVKGGAAIPAPQNADLKSAAAAASCTLINAPIEGNTHEDKNFTAADYKTNPPTSGNHNPVWYQDGIYNPGDTPKLGMLVHPLEHGRIEVQYQPGTPAHTVSQLETFVNGSDGGYHMLMFQNTTGMKYAVAATAWGHAVDCPTMSPKVFDALRDFRLAYIDKGPEVVP